MASRWLRIVLSVFLGILAVGLSGCSGFDNNVRSLSLYPDRGAIGDSLILTFKGEGIGSNLSATTVAFDPAGPIISTLTRGSDESTLLVGVTIPNTATEGSRSVSVKVGDTEYGVVPFEVQGVVITPKATRAGLRRVMTIRGIGVGSDASPTLYFTRPGSSERVSTIAVVGVTRVSGQEVRATLDVNRVAEGNYEAHLSSVSKPISYSVLSLPTVTSVTPSGGGKGVAVDVTIKGGPFSNDLTGDIATDIHVGSLLSDSVVTVSNLTIVDSGTITATFTTKTTTLADVYDVHVGKKSPDGPDFAYGNGDKMFRAGAGAPHIDSVDPIYQSEVENPVVTLRGTQLSGLKVEAVIGFTRAGDGSDLLVATDVQVRSDTEVVVKLHQKMQSGSFLAGRVGIGLSCDGVASNTVSFHIGAGD